MKLHEILRTSVETALSEFESIGPEMGSAARDFLSYIFSLRFLSDSNVVRVAKLSGFLDRFLGAFQGVLTRIPALIAAKLIVDQLTVPKELRYRVMKLDDVAKFPIEVMMAYGIRQRTSGGAMPPTMSLALTFSSLEKKVRAIIKGSVPGFLKALLGGAFSRLLRIAFLLIEAVQVWALVLCAYAYAKTLEEMTGEDTIFTKKLSQSAPRKTVREKIRRRVGGARP